MELNPGDNVFFRLMPGIKTYQGTIASVDETTLVLQPHDELPTDLTTGRYLIIPEADTDLDYYTEIVDIRKSGLRLKRLWTGRRGYFRVDDVFPMTARRIAADTSIRKSRIVAGYGTKSTEPDMPDGSISPQVWRILADINSKLEMILEKLYLESVGLTHSESVPVSISASGMKCTLQEKLEVNDIVEVTMSLPLYPPVGIVTYGEVVRVKNVDHGRCEIALKFINMDDDVRDEIIQYTLKRQREIIREQK